MKSTLLAAALALAATAAPAQTIFTAVGPDGHKSFSDRPDAMLESVQEAAAAIAARRAPAGTMAKGSRGAALVNSNEAQRRLAQAKLKRKQRWQPLPGESVKVPGGIVVNARYWTRQEKLRIEVEQAQRRSNETQRLLVARQ